MKDSQRDWDLADEWVERELEREHAATLAHVRVIAGAAALVEGDSEDAA